MKYSGSVLLKRIKWGTLVAIIPTVIATLITQNALDPKVGAWVTAGVAIVTAAFGADVSAFRDAKERRDEDE